MRHSGLQTGNEAIETRIYVLALIGFIAMSVSSCKKNNARREEVAKIVKEWTGREIKFPENVSCYVSGKETFTNVCNDYLYMELWVIDYFGVGNGRFFCFQLQKYKFNIFPHNCLFI